jgi:hypothetical protein
MKKGPALAHRALVRQSVRQLAQVVYPSLMVVPM